MTDFSIQTEDKYLICAITAVQKSCNLFQEGYGDVTSELKDDGSPLTEYDEQIETEIVTHLVEQFPDSQIIGEEGTSSGVDNGEVTWILDPIDGTINYELGSLPSAIAIGIEKDDELYGGVIGLPLEGKIYYGLVNGPAYENEEEVSVLETEALERFVVGAEFRPENLAVNGYYDMIETVAEETQTIRCVRSGISDGAHIASGRLHAAYNLETNIWDVAAPTALVRAAGGTVTTPSGSHKWEDIKTGHAVYSNGVHHEFFLQFF